MTIKKKKENRVTTGIPVLMVEGLPMMAFETRREFYKANPETVPGAALQEIPFMWDMEIAAQRQEERLGLLRSNQERNAIASYLRQAYPERLSRSEDVAQAVILEMESRWSRKLARFFQGLGWRGGGKRQATSTNFRGEGDSK